MMRRTGAVVWLAIAAACSNSPSKATSPSATTRDAAIASEAGSNAPADASADAQLSSAWDWVGIVGTGQSLSVGAHGTPFVSVTQPYHNLRLALGGATVPPFDPTIGTLSLVPLVEPLRAVAQTYPSAYPENLYGETPHTAMGSQITSLFQQTADGGDYVTVHTVVGESGQPMSVIDKGAVEVDEAGTSMGRAYAATLFEASAIARLAKAAKKTYGIGAIVITHGEADAGNAQYESDLVQLWSDYNADLSAVTGQTTSIPMFVSQQHSVPAGMGFTSASTLAEWQVGVDHPNDIICSGPKYQYPYFTDGIHLTTQGYDLLGEKYGEVFFQKVVLGQAWQPLQPTGVARAGTILTVQMHVPAPPLAWDDTLPSPHPTGYPQWTAGRGFEVLQNGSPVTISSVAIVDNTVQITCATDISTGVVFVSYAYTADGALMPGGTARWGHLRDSDAVVGATSHVPRSRTIASPSRCRFVEDDFGRSRGTRGHARFDAGPAGLYNSESLIARFEKTLR